MHRNTVPTSGGNMIPAGKPARTWTPLQLPPQRTEPFRPYIRQDPPQLGQKTIVDDHKQQMKG